MEASLTLDIEERPNEFRDGIREFHRLFREDSLIELNRGEPLANGVTELFLEEFVKLYAVFQNQPDGVKLFSTDEILYGLAVSEEETARDHDGPSGLGMFDERSSEDILAGIPNIKNSDMEYAIQVQRLMLLDALFFAPLHSNSSWSNVDEFGLNRWEWGVIGMITDLSQLLAAHDKSEETGSEQLILEV